MIYPLINGPLNTVTALIGSLLLQIDLLLNFAKTDDNKNKTENENENERIIRHSFNLNFQN